MAETVPIRRTSSILEEMEDRIMRRAHDIFSRNGIFGRDLENWLQAERELVWKPTVELCEKGDEFRLEAAVPGVDPKNIDIEVTPEDILLRAEIAHEHKEEKGTVHICEFDSGKMFRSIHLPKRINPNKVKAEFKNGILYLTADIAEEARVKKVKLEAVDAVVETGTLSRLHKRESMASMEDLKNARASSCPSPKPRTRVAFRA